MKDFQRFALEKAVEQYVENLGTAFLGGLMQGARGQSFDPVAAVKNPFQQRQTADDVGPGTEQGQQQPYSPQQMGQQYQHFLNARQQRIKDLQQWWANPKMDWNAITQHYQGNTQKFNNDLKNVQMQWLNDPKQQQISAYPSFVQQQLNLPQGSFG